MPQVQWTRSMLQADGRAVVTRSEPQEYAHLGAKWGEPALGTPGGTVTWTFAAGNPSGENEVFESFFTDAGQRQVIADAFDAWEAVANIDFQYADTDSPDVDIRIGYKDIDGASGTLAYAYSFRSYGTFIESFLAFDRAEQWTSDAPEGREISLSAVAIHEIGHALGLDHSDVDPAVMQAFYNESILTLQEDDIAAAQALYGAAGGDSGGSGGGAGPAGDDVAGDATTAATLPVGGTVDGTLERGGDTDWYRVSLTGGTVYAIDLTGAPSGHGTLPDPLVRVYDASGALVDVDDDGGSGLESSLSLAPATGGTYYISAEGYSANMGSYRLALSETGGSGDDYANGPETTGALSVGGSATGTVEVVLDSDWFAVELTAGQAYVFAQNGASANGGTLSDPYLTLFDPNGLPVASNDDSGSLNSRIEYVAEVSGTHYLGAAAYGSHTGSYTVSAEATGAAGTPGGGSGDDLPAHAGTGGRVTVGGSATGTVETARDTDWFAVDLQAGQSYTVAASGTGAEALRDTVLWVYDAAGFSIAYDDDGGAGLNSQATVTSWESGTYYVAVGGYGSRTGGYTVSVEGDGSGADPDPWGAATPRTPPDPAAPARDDHAGSATTTGTLAVGGSASGELESFDDSDWFAVTLTGGVTYRFDMTGMAGGGGTLSDPILSLRDADGTEVARNDDGGTGFDSQLHYTPVAGGVFYLDAQAYGGFGLGTYTVSATVSSASAAAAAWSPSTALDVKEGTAAADVLWGGEGPQILLAHGGDDEITGGAGDDRIEGGSGEDTAVFSGAEADYNVEAKDGRVIVTHLSGEDGRDTLIGVEKLAFSDKTVTLDDIAGGGSTPASPGGTAGDDRLTPDFATTIDGGAGLDTMVFAGARDTFTVTGGPGGLSVSGSGGSQSMTGVERLAFDDGVLAFDVEGAAGQAYRLYNAALDRVPDARGLGYWVGLLDGGADLATAAAGFIASPEFQGRYGGLDDRGFVAQLYRNILDREPDAEGLSFWADHLGAGQGRDWALAGISESAENKDRTAALVEDGIFYTLG